VVDATRVLGMPRVLSLLANGSIWRRLMIDICRIDRQFELQLN
jgi:hypothetical protein